MKRLRAGWLAAGWLVLAPAVVAARQAGQDATAQSVREELTRLRQEFEALRQQYGDRLAALEAKLAALDAAAPAAGTPALAKALNPDISVVGSFLGTAGRNRVEPAPGLELSETELSFQAAVDPYARADFHLSVGPDGGAEVEEGYLTLTSLPGSFLVKVGKLHAAYGKVNQAHVHTLPWADRPLMSVNLAGGDEGISDAGVSVSRLIPNPLIFLEATGEVYRGDSSIFRAPSPGDLAYVGRLRAYGDLTEAANLDLGASVAYGHNESAEPGSTTRLIGLDATFRFRPPQRAYYPRVLGRAELTWSRRSELRALPQSFGAYVFGEYQFARRWAGGARLDYADRAENPFVTDKGASALLTFRPSEFSLVRGQYRRTRYGDASRVATEFLVQFLFSIGAHGAHPF